MSELRTQIKDALEKFDSLSPEEIVKFLNAMSAEFRTDITREYLTGKIAKLADINDENERTTYCKQFRPYFDWYLNGN